MAILLKESGAVFYEIPKTGTTFVRNFLTDQGIEWELLKPKVPCCPRHSPWYCYNAGKSFSFVAVRQPVTWYESFWKFHRNHTGKEYQPQQWYIHQRLHMSNNQVEKTFSAWMQRLIDTQPGVYSEIVQQFTGISGLRAVNCVLHLENLESELRELLTNTLKYTLKPSTCEIDKWETPKEDVKWDKSHLDMVRWLDLRVVRDFYDLTSVAGGIRKMVF